MAGWMFAIFLAFVLACTCVGSSSQPLQKPLQGAETANLTQTSSVSQSLFDELDQLARIVDISYCVGTTGIQPPFSCLGRCQDFPDFELVKTWSTGVLLSDSCGFIALDHTKSAPRIIVAFRGTYSITNTVVDLSTTPQEYTPYPGNNSTDTTECPDCAVHSGFFRSWKHTRDVIIPDLEATIASYPSYKIHLVGHSLGGAVALFAALEFKGRGWDPIVTTFGEPRTGNGAFATFVDANLVNSQEEWHGDADTAAMTYRRVTHVDDPVPLLPLTEWGYRPHAGEIYIAKSSVPPAVSDLTLCQADADVRCSAGADSSLIEAVRAEAMLQPEVVDADTLQDTSHVITESAGWFQTRLKLWQLFFAHRDYFWRLGVCFQTSNSVH